MRSLACLGWPLAPGDFLQSRVDSPSSLITTKAISSHLLSTPSVSQNHFLPLVMTLVLNTSDSSTSEIVLQTSRRTGPSSGWRKWVLSMTLM